MKSIKIFALTALAAIGLAACQNQDGTQGNAANNGEANVSFSFTLPQGAATRAANQIATGDEIKVNTVSVFIFDKDGNAATEGHFTTLAPGDFDITKRNGQDAVYTLKDEKAIETNVGNVKIYVGVNLPTTLDHAYTSMTAMAAATKAVNANGEEGASQTFAKAQSFTMFSRTAATATLEKDKTTSVNIEVERVVAKVVTTVASSDLKFDATMAGSTDKALWSNGVQLTYTIEAFNVYNEMSRSNLIYAENTCDWNSLYNDLQSYFKKTAGGVVVSNAGANKAVTYYAYGITGHQDGSALDAELAAKDGFYIGENYSKYNPGNEDGEKGRLVAAAEGVSRNESTTHVFVATRVKSNKKATGWDSSTKTVTWDNVGTDGTEDLYIMRIKDFAEPVICASETVSKTISNGLIADAGLINTDIKIYTYLDSYVHFPVYVHRDAKNDYNVYRNDFVHVHVTGVIGSTNQDLNNDGKNDGDFPGYPGHPDDPKKPIDPTATNPNNPDPKDPEGPVEDELAKLVVKITVKDWVYKHTSAILQK